MYIASSPYDNDRYAHDGEWFTDRKAAVEKAYQMKYEAIENLFEQIYQLDKIEFK